MEFYRNMWKEALPSKIIIIGRLYRTTAIQPICSDIRFSIKKSVEKATRNNVRFGLLRTYYVKISISTENQRNAKTISYNPLKTDWLRYNVLVEKSVKKAYKGIKFSIILLRLQKNIFIAAKQPIISDMTWKSDECIKTSAI